MSIAQRNIDGAPEWYDTTTQETVFRVAPISFADDFIRHKGAVISRSQLDTQEILGSVSGEDPTDPLFDQYPNAAALPWDTIDESGQVVTLLDSTKGEVQLGVTAENAAQSNVFYFGDTLTLNANNDLVWEARVKLTTLPTGEGSELTDVFIGLASVHSSTVSAMRTAAWFRCSGSGEIWTDTRSDGTDTGLLQTGESMTAGIYRVFRISIHGTSVTYSIDGTTIGTYNFTAGENLQPYFRVSKSVTTANTTTATMVVDYVKAWMVRA